MLAMPQNLPHEVQVALPIMANLDLEQRAFIAGFLLSNSKNIDKQADNKPKINRVGANLLGVSFVSDDFDDDLGDDFWLGNDNGNTH